MAEQPQCQRRVVPVIYRRPDPAATAAARVRLSRLTSSLPREPEDRPARPAEVDLPVGPTTGQPTQPSPPTPSGPFPAAKADAPLSNQDTGRSSPDADSDRRPTTSANSPQAESLSPGATLDPQWSAWFARHVPTPLRAPRLDPGRRGLAAVALVAVLAAAVAAFGVWRSRPQPIEVATPPVTAPAAAPSTSPTATVVVAVAGGVRRPGLFTLPVGSRVADAIRAAGGVRAGTNIGLLNLARRLVDGEQVIVGAVAGSQPAAPAGAPAAPGAPLNLNTATLEQLDALPGVGPVLAQRILDYRTQHGAFRSVDQLREVTGIGEAKYADLRALVSV